MACQQEHTPIVIPTEDSIIHSGTHLFCAALPCPHHNDQEQRPAALPADLSTLSTLWMPLHESRQQWAAFGKEALTTSALMASSTAFSGLYWEARALQHYTWATDEREHGRWHRVIFWLSRAVQDLDCALDQCQQVLSWLDLAGNDHRQQDPESLQMIRSLMAQVQWHQGRRRALHQQVLREYSEARQHKQQQRAQQDSQHVTGPLSEAQEEEV